MSKQIKVLVLAFLQNQPENDSDKFNKAFELYRQLPTKSRQAEIHYNRGFEKQKLKNLLYDLQKLSGISDLEVAAPVAKATHEADVDIPVIDLTKKLQGENEDDETKEVLEDAFTQKEMDIITSGVADTNITTEDLENASKGLREEFPFLNSADCPSIMYVVVGRRISAHNEYISKHAELQEINAGTKTVTEEEKAILVAYAEAAFNENRKLWDELNHYADKGEILGKHSLFRESNIQTEVETMTTDEMFKFKTSSVKYFHDQKKNLEKHKDNPEKLEEVNQRIEDRNYKLSLVNAKIGVADAGAAKK